MSGREQMERRVGDALFVLRGRAHQWSGRLRGTDGKPSPMARAWARVRAIRWGLALRPGEWVRILREIETKAGQTRQGLVNRRPVLFVGVALLIAAGALANWLIVAAPSIPTLAHDAWYFDLANQELFVASSDAVPPIPGPHPPLGEDGTPVPAMTAVRAHLYSCGSCADASARFIAYLETTQVPRSAATVAADASSPATSPASESAASPVAVPMVAAYVPAPAPAPAPDAAAAPALEWIVNNGPAAEGLIAKSQNRCPGGAAATRCEP